MRPTFSLNQNSLTSLIFAHSPHSLHAASTMVTLQQVVAFTAQSARPENRA